MYCTSLLKSWSVSLNLLDRTSLHNTTHTFKEYFTLRDESHIGMGCVLHPASKWESPVFLWTVWKLLFRALNLSLETFQTIMFSGSQLERSSSCHWVHILMILQCSMSERWVGFNNQYCYPFFVKTHNVTIRPACSQSWQKWRTFIRFKKVNIEHT